MKNQEPTRIIDTRTNRRGFLRTAGGIVLATGAGILLNNLERKTALACADELGAPNPNGFCPADRQAEIRLFGFHYLDTNNNRHYGAGERPISTVKGGRFMEIQFWGWPDYIYAPDARNKKPDLRRLLASEDGNGIGVDIETGNPFVLVGFKGPVNDFEEGVDPLDNIKKPYPVINFQFRWYNDNWQRIIFDSEAQKPAVWEGCAFLCPKDQPRKVADYYIATHKTLEELASLGLRDRSAQMAVPQGAPRSAAWTADLK